MTSGKVMKADHCHTLIHFVVRSIGAITIENTSQLITYRIDRYSSSHAGIPE